MSPDLFATLLLEGAVLVLFIYYVVRKDGSSGGVKKKLDTAI